MHLMNKKTYKLKKDNEIKEFTNECFKYNFFCLYLPFDYNYVTLECQKNCNYIFINYEKYKIEGDQRSRNFYYPFLENSLQEKSYSLAKRKYFWISF